MTTLKLRPLRREADLQKLINAWGARPERWRVAGPKWFNNLPSPNVRERFTTSLGYGFEPDAVFETPEEVVVAELKLSPEGKFEALALPEVLHHVWMLRNDSVLSSRFRGKHIVPLILTPPLPWLTASLKLLVDEHGLAEGAVRLLAFDALDSEGGPIFWTGNPLANWEPVSRDAVPPSLLREFGRFPHWYCIRDEGAWFGLKAECARRPAFSMGEHVEATKIDGGTGLVACMGEYGKTDWEYHLVC